MRAIRQWFHHPLPIVCASCHRLVWRWRARSVRTTVMNAPALLCPACYDDLYHPFSKGDSQA
jgi:hypothetical protein